MLFTHTRVLYVFARVAFVVVLFPRTPALAQEWKEVPMPESGLPWYLDMASSQPGHLILATGAQTFWSWDEGQTWSTAQYPSTGDSPNGGIPNVHHVDIVAFDPSCAVVSESANYDKMEQGRDHLGRLAVTIDSGKSWIEVTAKWEAGFFNHTQRGPEGKTYFPFSGRNGGGGLSPGYQYAGGYFETTNGSDLTKVSYDSVLGEGQAVVEGGGNVYFARLQDHYVSTDNGETFSQRANYRVDSDTLLSIYSLKRLETGTYLAGDDRYVYRSSDAGASWIRVGQGRSAEFTDGYGIAYHIAYEHHYFSGYRTAGSDSLLNYSTDDGLTWRTWTFDGMVSSVVPVTPTLTYVLAGNKIYKRELPASIQSEQPEGETLIRNNPVGDHLLLTKSPSTSEATIFDLAGRAVLRSRATDRIDLTSLPVGMYQLVLTSPGATRSQKFIIER